jgi:hypothetical protein
MGTVVDSINLVMFLVLVVTVGTIDPRLFLPCRDASCVIASLVYFCVLELGCGYFCKTKTQKEKKHTSHIFTFPYENNGYISDKMITLPLPYSSHALIFNLNFTYSMMKQRSGDFLCVL